MMQYVLVPLTAFADLSFFYLGFVRYHHVIAVFFKMHRDEGEAMRFASYISSAKAHEMHHIDINLLYWTSRTVIELSL